MGTNWLLLGLALLGDPGFLKCSLVMHRVNPQFTKGMAKQLHEGMTKAEVVAVLGKPPGNYAGSNTSYLGSGPKLVWLHPEGWRYADGTTGYMWISDAGAVGTSFSPDGKLERAWGESVLVAEPDPPLAGLRRAVWNFLR
jgi:hypothetical protein